MSASATQGGHRPKYSVSHCIVLSFGRTYIAPRLHNITVVQPVAQPAVQPVWQTGYNVPITGNYRELDSSLRVASLRVT